MEFYVRRQQYLEALSWQGAGGSPPENLPWRPHRHPSQYSNQEIDSTVDMEVVLSLLKKLESLCIESVLVEIMYRNFNNTVLL